MRLMPLVPTILFALALVAPQAAALQRRSLCNTLMAVLPLTFIPSRLRPPQASAASPSTR
jgi:hypothetical protein